MPKPLSNLEFFVSYDSNKYNLFVRSNLPDTCWKIPDKCWKFLCHMIENKYNLFFTIKILGHMLEISRQVTEIFSNQEIF